MVRVLFALARHLQPSVVFIDEADALFTKHSSPEPDRLKANFVAHIERIKRDSGARVFVLGATTSRPQDLDEAARRCFATRVSVGLLDVHGRRDLLQKLLRGTAHNITPAEFEQLAERTRGFTAASLTRLCHQAALVPLRELAATSITTVAPHAVRPITAADFGPCTLSSVLSQR